jgi:hypothetical protein
LERPLVAKNRPRTPIDLLSSSEGSAVETGHGPRKCIRRDQILKKAAVDQSSSEHDSDSDSLRSLNRGKLRTTVAPTPSPRPAQRAVRLDWSCDEVQALQDGVARFGSGKWKKILEYYRSEFDPKRTAEKLKVTAGCCYD